MELENINQTLAQAIVLTAIEDVEREGQRARLVREWLDHVDLGALVRAGLGIEELSEQEAFDKQQS